MGAYLTDTQARIAQVLVEWTDTRGYPPSMREIAEAVGLASASSVAYQLQAMERKGIGLPARSRPLPS